MDNIEGVLSHGGPWQLEPASSTQPPKAKAPARARDAVGRIRGVAVVFVPTPAEAGGARLPGAVGCARREAHDGAGGQQADLRSQGAVEGQAIEVEERGANNAPHQQHGQRAYGNASGGGSHSLTVGEDIGEPARLRREKRHHAEDECSNTCNIQARDRPVCSRRDSVGERIEGHEYSWIEQQVPVAETLLAQGRPHQAWHSVVHDIIECLQHV
mmetsp:Transcript_52484/g.135459  ORF Transcript_52484/g.135459 Transcript_52484/m.135459 type:complete len:214 (+) Transcript_52484:374-1015(+)